VSYTVHVTAFCLGGAFFSGHGVDIMIHIYNILMQIVYVCSLCEM